MVILLRNRKIIDAVNNEEKFSSKPYVVLYTNDKLWHNQRESGSDRGRREKLKVTIGGNRNKQGKGQHPQNRYQGGE